MTTNSPQVKKRAPNVECLMVINNKGMPGKEKIRRGYVPVTVDGEVEYLTPPQEAFCQHYVKMPSAPTRAALHAGFGGSSPTKKHAYLCAKRTQLKLRRMAKVAIRCQQLQKISASRVHG